MLVRRGPIIALAIGILLIIGTASPLRNIAPTWNFKIEDVTDSAMSRNGEYTIVVCENGPSCESGQFYVFDQYGNTKNHDCIREEITAVDIADNGTFFIGTRNGYYFSSISEVIKEDLTMGSTLLSVSISENGESAIVGTSNQILIFNQHGLKGKKDVKQPASSTAISASGDIAVAGTTDTVYLYRNSTNDWENLPSAIAKPICLGVSDDGTTIVSGLGTGLVRILDSELRIRDYFEVPNLTCIAVSAKGNHIICGGENGEIRLYNSSENQLLSYDMKSAIREVSISSDGSLIAALSENITLFEFPEKEIKEIQEFKSSATIQTMQMSKSGEVLSYVSNEELVFRELCRKSYKETHEYKLPSRRSIPLADELVEVWSYGNNPRSAIAADINGDGKDEIICTFTKQMAVLTSEGKLLWKKSFTFQPGISIMDLTGDLIPEILVKSDDKRMGLQIFSGEGEKLAWKEFYKRWYDKPPLDKSGGIGIFPLWSGDIDNDGVIEVICKVHADYVLEPRGLYAFEYPSFEEEWYYPVAPHLFAINFVDITGDGQVEILAGSEAPYNGRKVGDTSDCYAYVYAVTLKGKEIWKRRFGECSQNRVHIAVVDLDNDGEQEIVGGGWSFSDDWGTLFVLNPEGDFIFGGENEFDHSVFLKAVADLDGDGDLEILTSTSSMLVLYDHRLREIKNKRVSMPLNKYTEITVNDIDADGSKEIIFTSEDPKLLILDNNLEEKWDKKFYGYAKYLKAVVVNLQMCKNHLLVLSDKLRAYTYSNNSEWPCTPWVILKEEKAIEAEEHFKSGEEYYEEENYEDARAEFAQARTVYGDIDDESGISSADEEINKVEICMAAVDSFEEVKVSLSDGDKLLIQYSTEEYLDNAEKFLDGIETKLTEVKNSFDEVEKPSLSEETGEYFLEIGELREAIKSFDKGRIQIEEGLINEGKINMDKAKSVFYKYEWSEHIEKIEEIVTEAEPPEVTTGGLSFWEKIGIACSIIGLIATVSFFLYDRRRKRLDAKSDITDNTTMKIETIFKPMFSELQRKNQFLQMDGIPSLNVADIKDHIFEEEWERIQRESSKYQIPANLRNRIETLYVDYRNFTQRLIKFVEYWQELACEKTGVTFPDPVINDLIGIILAISFMERKKKSGEQRNRKQIVEYACSSRGIKVTDDQLKIFSDLLNYLDIPWDKRNAAVKRTPMKELEEDMHKLSTQISGISSHIVKIIEENGIYDIDHDSELL